MTRDAEAIACSYGECKVITRVESIVLVVESPNDVIEGNMLRFSPAVGVLSSQLEVSDT